VPNRRIEFVVALITIVAAAALEELFPPFLGVGFPFLMASVLVVSRRRRFVAAVFFAVAAGACEDAVSALPPFMSVGFFLAVSLIARNIPLPRGTVFIVYPLYQLYLAVWISDLNGGIFLRMLSAIPVGAAVIAVSYPVLLWLDGKAGVNDQE
jgi:hypothetical protein